MAGVLDVVTQKDLNRLLDCAYMERDLSKRGTARRQAMRVLIEILDRLPAPRAYIIEPTHLPAHPERMQVWDLGVDLLTAQLHEQDVSVIDPTSLRMLVLFCPAFHDVLESTDTLWLNLVAAGVIEEVYIPNDGQNNKRHANAVTRAKGHNIRVHTWHLENGRSPR